MGCSSNKHPIVSDEKGRCVFVIGGPCSGRTTQCKNIVTEFKYVQYSLEEIFNKIINEKNLKDWELLELDLKRGKYISSERVVKFLKTLVSNSIEKKILFRDFPRDHVDLEEWKQKMNDVADIKAILYLVLEDEEIVKRCIEFGQTEDSARNQIEKFKQDIIPIIPEFEENKKLIKIDANDTEDLIFYNIKREFIERKLYV
jgi:adenylate kinase family enzyme